MSSWCKDCSVLGRRVMGATRRIVAVALTAMAVICFATGCAHEKAAEKAAEKPQVSEKPSSQPPAPEQIKPAPEPLERVLSKTPKLTLRATRAGNAGTRSMGDVMLVIGAESTRWAAVLQTESGKYVVDADGEGGSEYDSIEGALFFSLDSKRLAYSAMKGKGRIVVVDGAERPESGMMAGFIFSPDSQHYAYAVTSQTGVYIVRDGVQDKAYKSASGPIYSPDSKRVAYSATNDERKWFVVLDGIEGKAYNKISWMIFSGDSKHFAYCASAEEGWRVVLDDKEMKAYPSITAEAFCADSKTVAYLAGPQDNETLVMNETEMPQYRTLPVFSPDLLRAAYVAAEGGKKCAVMGDKPGNKYDEIRDITFSPDSKRVAYIASSDRKWACVLDGAEGTAYDKIIEGSPRFSVDSKHLAYVARRGEDEFIVLDGMEGKAYRHLMPPQGARVEPGNIRRPFFFSPDSRHIAYYALGETGFVVVVDGSEIPVVLSLAGDMLFDEPGKIHAIMLRGTEIYMVEITYTEESVPAPNP